MSVAHGLRTFFVTVDRSRGTGPRATEKGFIEPSRGTGPRATGKGRVAAQARIAGDRPPRYVNTRPAFFLWKINRKSAIIKHIKSIGGTWR